jgi:L-ascorbate metabolism protein UlaG (beta-lactamase superfamily)
MAITIKWLAHAAFLIKNENKTIYLDPRYMKKFANKIGSFFDKPEEADIILFTHHHADHCYPSSIKKMRTSKTIIIAPERCAERLGGKITKIKPGEELTIEGIKIKAVHAYNLKRGRTPGTLWHPKGMGVGFLLTLDGKTIYHAGDTEFIPEMQQFGKVDLALLPIDGKFTMSIEEAVQAAKVINPKIVIPMHNHDNDPETFKEKLESNSTIEVVPLKIGEAFQLK